MFGNAHSLFEIKSIDAKRRILRGMASTPTPDRGGDIVEPKGVQFTNPLPLLLHHDSRRPVGTVKFEKATDAGIAFEAHIPEIKEPGTLADRVLEAWQSVESGLLKGVSIGYRILAGGAEFIRETGGLHLKSIEVFELSLVAVPMNADATIQSIKSIDAQHLAASGQQVAASSSKPLSGDSDAPRRAATPVRREKTVKKSYSDQIKDFEATRASLVAERDAIMDTAAEKGETLDEEQRQSYDDLDTKIKSTDEHLVRLRVREEEMKKSAVAVSGADPVAAAKSRGVDLPVIRVTDTTPPDLEFARMVLCKAASFLECSKGNFVSPLQIAKKRYPIR
jgi:HK97 family phage prohead protease